MSEYIKVSVIFIYSGCCSSKLQSKSSLYYNGLSLAAAPEDITHKKTYQTAGAQTANCKNATARLGAIKLWEWYCKASDSQSSVNGSALREIVWVW